MIITGTGPFARGGGLLKKADLPMPEPGEGEILIRVRACGVCHTELDEIEGRTPPSRFPVVPGHQVVGTVAGSRGRLFRTGDRVGIAWIYSACGKCGFCQSGRENLCPDFRATGRDADGGYAEYMKAPEAFAYPIPRDLPDAEAAPLLCAGAVGFRSLRLARLENGGNLGLTGFGASGHLVLKTVQYVFPRSRVFVFARNAGERRLAEELGACWTGTAEEYSPELLDCVIDTTPAWKPAAEAMKNLKPGGRLVINAIRKEETDKESLLKLDYAAHLWMEKEIKTVANVTRKDVEDFLKIASEIPIRPVTETYALEDAETALAELKERKIRGAKVLLMI
jgi:propanol-preferring alcohol dehydrogenase